VKSFLGDRNFNEDDELKEAVKRVVAATGGIMTEYRNQLGRTSK